MSVIGIGIDLVDVAGFGEQLDTPGTRFELLAFSAGERAHVGSKEPGRVRGLAARYAAKEAFIKAWSTSRFGEAPTLDSWELREVEVVSDAHGRPSRRLSGAVETAVRAQLGDRFTAHLSMTHDGPSAAAVVVLEGPSDGVLAAVHDAVNEARVEAEKSSGTDSSGTDGSGTDSSGAGGSGSVTGGADNGADVDGGLQS
ncbi:hypothetical protein BH10ACT3_BH10ACT3_02500 [soil metagenome]